MCLSPLNAELTEIALEECPALMSTVSISVPQEIRVKETSSVLSLTPLMVPGLLLALALLALWQLVKTDVNKVAASLVGSIL